MLGESGTNERADLKSPIANFFSILISTAKNNKSAEISAEDNSITTDLTDAFRNGGNINCIINVTQRIFTKDDGKSLIEVNKLIKFRQYLEVNKKQDLLKEYEKFLRQTISQGKKEQNSAFFSDEFACVGGVISRLVSYNDPPFQAMIIGLVRPDAASFVSDDNQVHIIALLHFLAGFGTTDVHKFRPAIDPLMTKEVMEELCQLIHPFILLDKIVNKITNELWVLGEFVNNVKDDMIITINSSNAKISIETLIDTIKAAYPHKNLYNLPERLGSPQCYLLDPKRYPFFQKNKEDIKSYLFSEIKKIISEVEEKEIDQDSTEQEARFNQISKLFLIFVRGHHDYQLTIEDFKELVGKGKILKRIDDKYEISSEFNNILPNHLKEYFSDKFLNDFITPLIDQLTSNKEIFDAINKIKSINHQKENFTEEEKSFIISVLDKKCNYMNLLHILAKDVDVTQKQITALLGIITKEKKILLIDGEDSNGSRPLHIAAENGCIEIILAFIREGVKVNQYTTDGFTELHIATQKGYIEIVKALTRKGADVDQGTEYGFTALHIAAQEGHIEIVEFLATYKFLIDAESGVDIVSKYGSTALHLAAKGGHIEIVKFLINNGADVDQATKYGLTALHIAAQEGHIEIVKFLIEEKKINVNQATSKSGSTALYIAAKNGHIEIVKFLINNGADVNQASEEGFTALYIAAKEGHIEIVKFLIEEEKININQASEDGFTPLHIAAANGHLGAVKALAENKATNLDKPTSKSGSTALHIAAKNGHIDIVKALIEHGANVNIPTNLGFTPIHAAAAKGCIEIVKFLINNGADVNQASEEGLTALHVAAKNGHIEIVKFLIEEKKINVNQATSKSGSTALYIAAKNGHIEIVINQSIN